MKIKLNYEAKKVIEVLERNEYKTYIVGGAIRDHFLSIPANDIDIATNASLEEIEKIFTGYKVVKYKKGHTCGIIIKNKMIEVSTFNGENILEDLSNRDFTINAMAYNALEGLIDPFNGKLDIENKIIKAVKEPIDTITNDPIRILRAIRFKAILGMDIDKELKGVIIDNCNLINNIKKNRLQRELDYILLSNKPSIYIKEFKEVFFEIFEPLKSTYNFEQHSKWHHLDVFEHTMVVLDSVECNLLARWSAFLHDIKKPECFSVDENNQGHFYNHFKYSSDYAKSILINLNYPNKFVEDVAHIIYYHDRTLSNEQKSILKLLNSFGEKNIDTYFDLRRADIIGQNPELNYRLVELKEIEFNTYKLIAIKAPYKHENLHIDGNNLLALGFSNEKIKDALEKILDRVMNGKLSNEKQQLIEYAKEIKK